MKITNKSALRELNLEGNMIEHYALCTFISLKSKGFNNLIMLNNKDYSSWGRKTKVPSMRKINNKLGKIEKSMSRNLEKVVRNNYK